MSLATLLLAASIVAADDPPKWDPARTTSPETVAELRAMELLIQDINAKAQPTVVGITPASGMTSGVIVREDGLVLTTAHAGIKPGMSVTFVLPDGTQVKGRGLGLNPKTDCGMARITDPPPKTAKWPGAADGKWPVAALGKAADLKKGQWLVALGHPGGPKPDRPPTIRVGRFLVPTRSDGTLRTSCILTGGDTGGPLLDLTGKVVAIHSKIGLFLEYNMHVPTEEFQAEWDQLLRGEVIGKTAHADLGFELAADKPVVTAVTAAGPADKAGVRRGDVVTHFDGEPITSPSDVALILHGKDPGQRVDLEVRRGAATQRLTITLGKKSPPTEKK